MSDFLTPTITAVLARLSADSGVQSLLGNPARIIDQMGTAPAFPYLRLTNVETRDASLKGLGAITVIVTLQILSRSRKGDEVRQGLAKVRDCLHEASFTIAGAALARCSEDMSVQHADGDVTLGTARYRLVVSG